MKLLQTLVSVEEEAYMYKPSFHFILLIFTVLVIFMALPLYGQPSIPKDTKYSAPITHETKNVSDHAKDTSDNEAATTRTMPKENKIKTMAQPPQGNAKDDYANNNLMKRWGKWLWTFIKWLWTIETLTFFLVIATLILAIAALRQGKYFRRELVLTQRPKLRVRNVVTTNFPDKWKIGEPMRGQLYIANIGSMPAKITNIGCWVKCLKGGLPMEKPYEGETPNYKISTRLEAGQSFPLKFVDSISMGPAVDVIIMGKDEYTLYVMGYVEYVDDIGTLRRTTFCRGYRLPGKRVGESREGRRFFAVDDPDYEYEE